MDEEDGWGEDDLDLGSAKGERLEEPDSAKGGEVSVAELQQRLEEPESAKGGEVSVAELQQRLEEAESARRSEREALEVRLQEVMQKAKDRLLQMQGRMQEMQDTLTSKDEQLANLQATRAPSSVDEEEEGMRSERQDPAARISELEPESGEKSSRSAGPSVTARLEELEKRDAEHLQRIDELEQECDKLRGMQTAATEECDKLRGMQAAATEECDKLRGMQAAATEGDAEAIKKELQEARAESEAKLGEVVRRSKEHLLALQGRLEAATAENAQLSERNRELDEAYQQQQEKVQKMRQLVTKANEALAESECREKALSESLSKSQSQRLLLQEQMGSMEKNLSVAPSREEIQQRGGIILAVESDDDVWCLISTGVSADGTSASEVPDASKRARWWPLSLLDVAERPVPLQRRWKGEVSALRAQVQRFKKKSEELQEEFDAYKEKANAALQSSASSREELTSKERQAEQLGEQLQAMALELQRSQAEKARHAEEQRELRRQVREAEARRAEVERAMDRKAREAEERCEAELESSRASFEARMDELERGWRERERSYRQELDLRRTQKEAHDEEVETLRALLDSRAAAESKAEAVATPTAPKTDSAAQTEEAFEASPEPEAKTFEAPEAPVRHESSDSLLPPQAYSLHASVAWQDLVSLRSQVRQLEARLQEEQGRHATALKESELGKRELQEIVEQHKLQQNIGQHQQMEYIRNVFRKFVETMPSSNAESEQLVPVLMTFFQFSSDDVKAVQAKRGSRRPWNLFGGR